MKSRWVFKAGALTSSILLAGGFVWYRSYPQRHRAMMPGSKTASAGAMREFVKAEAEFSKADFSAPASKPATEDKFTTTVLTASQTNFVPGPRLLMAGSKSHPVNADGRDANIDGAVATTTITGEPQDSVSGGYLYTYQTVSSGQDSYLAEYRTPLNLYGKPAASAVQTGVIYLKQPDGTYLKTSPSEAIMILFPGHAITTVVKEKPDSPPPAATKKTRTLLPGSKSDASLFHTPPPPYVPPTVAGDNFAPSYPEMPEPPEPVHSRKNYREVLIGGTKSAFIFMPETPKPPATSPPPKRTLIGGSKNSGFFEPGDIQRKQAPESKDHGN